MGRGAAGSAADGPARPLACGLFACIGGAFLLLVHAFVVNDFTVRYVAENSNSALPVWYRGGGVCGGVWLLLLWVLLLSVWTFAVAIFSRRMPLDAVARVLAVMGMIAFGFLLFILFTSNPFTPRACRSTRLMVATSIRCCRISA